MTFDQIISKFNNDYFFQDCIF